MKRLITFAPQAIKQLDGLYCLNDLHRLSGDNPKHKPSNFIRKDTTQGLIQALANRFSNMSNAHKSIMDSDFSNMRTDNQISNMSNAQNIIEQRILTTIQGGLNQGSYACRELVYAYAMWIDPNFYLLVLEVFDRVAVGAVTYTAKINQLVSELNAIASCLSMAGRVLAVEGKQTKPQMLKDLNQLLEQQQPQLNFGGASHE